MQPEPHRDRAKNPSARSVGSESLLSRHSLVVGVWFALRSLLRTFVLTTEPIRPNIPDMWYRACCPLWLGHKARGGVRMQRGYSSKFDELLYAGTIGQGVQRSRDGGEHWEAINYGLPPSAMRALVAHPSIIVSCSLAPTMAVSQPG